jgi:hypothetical protein
MAFPSTTGSKRDDLQTAWGTVRSLAAAVKAEAQNIRTLSAAGTLGAANLLHLVTFLADVKSENQRLAAVPGLQAYAQSQVNNTGLDLAAEFTAMRTQLDATTAWVVANFPKDANGFLLAQTIGADGRQVDRVFTAAQTAALRTVLDALIATID